MQFYETISASSLGFSQAVFEMVVNRHSSGFLPWVLKEKFKRIENELIIPDNRINIVFICDDDLGKTKPVSAIGQFSPIELMLFNHGSGIHILDDRDLFIPDDRSLKEVNIPHDREFTYEPNPLYNDGDNILNKRDYLGIYYPYDHNTKLKGFIFIRVDKILRDPYLQQFPIEGISSVVLHELGHSFVDFRIIDTLKCNDSSITATDLANMDYIIEEAVANAFAYRSLKTLTCRENGQVMNNISSFMMLQPYAYAFGRELARGKDIDLQQLIIKWCKIKCGRLCYLDSKWRSYILPLNWPLSTERVKRFIYSL